MNFYKNTIPGLCVLIAVSICFFIVYYRFDHIKDIAMHTFFLIILLIVCTTFVLFQFQRTFNSIHRLEIKVKKLHAELSLKNGIIKKLNEEMEQQVKKRTEQLEKKNRELESFCHSLSHDLRAPLRAIDGFTEILFEDYYDLFDYKGKDNVKRICKGSKKLINIIDEMLKLAHINKKEICIQNVNLSTIAHEYKDLIIETNSEYNVKFIIAPDLTARGDYGLLDTAISNILNNAVKYSSKKENPIIEFNMNYIKNEENNTDLQKRVFYIRDNGVGFDMKYVNTIFDAFKRLHNSDEFDGTGIGLATVKQIFDRHGGKVWVESQLNIGTTVYFTLG